MSETEIIGARVRDLRKDRGRSQEELGELLKLDKSAISRIESGRRGLAVQEVALIAPFLGVSADEILFGADAAQDTLLLRGEGDSTEAAVYADRVIDDFLYVAALLA